MISTKGAEVRRARMAILLVLASLVVVALGAGAVLVTQSFRRSADGVLNDYTTLAADRIAQNLEIALARSLFPIVNVARSALLDQGWTPNTSVLITTRNASSPHTSSIEGIFVRRDTLWQVFPTETRIAPELLGQHVTSWSNRLEPNAYFGLEFANDLNQFLVYDVEQNEDDEIILAYGVILTADSLREFIAQTIANSTSLPRHLTTEISQDSIHSIVIATSKGHLVASQTLADTLALSVNRDLRSPPGLRVHVTLSRALQNRLIHGGPSIVTPWILLSLALLAIFLIVSATILWRQDRRLALLREQFVAGVSHELRTPLAQIRLFAETLSLGRVRDESEVRNAHRVVQQETRRLTHLVENLLLFSRQERDILKLNKRRADVSDLVTEIAEEFQPLAHAAGASLETDIEPQLFADVDSDAFRQIVLNLLDNAIKYGPAHQTVRLELARVNANLSLAVEDQGPGIPSEHHTRVWDRFWRSPEAIRAGKGGSGIGLTVVRELTERHGGTVSLAPRSAGRGARFVVQIPITETTDS